MICRTFTVQLPLFNEMYVVRAVVKAGDGNRLPRERMEIHVSTIRRRDGEHCQRQFSRAYAAKGSTFITSIATIARGFKAGALENGMKDGAKGNLIAIFDADFVPNLTFCTAWFTSSLNRRSLRADALGAYQWLVQSATVATIMLDGAIS